MIEDGSTEGQIVGVHFELPMDIARKSLLGDLDILIFKYSTIKKFVTGYIVLHHIGRGLNPLING
jgi:hypothetical protein